MSKSINDLREGLFEAMQMLKDGTLTVEQAKAISEMSQVIVNTAKVEVDHIRARGGDGHSVFIGCEKDITPGVVGITRHRLAG